MWESANPRKNGGASSFNAEFQRSWTKPLAIREEPAGTLRPRRMPLINGLPLSGASGQVGDGRRGTAPCQGA